MEDFIFELKRKLVHVLSIVYIIVYSLLNELFSKRTALLTLVLILIILSFLEFLQMKYNRKIPIFHQFYRENERDSFSGSIYLLIGTIIAFAVFDFNIAVTAILMMFLGDTASALVGRLGKHRVDGIKVSVEGIIAEFLVNLAVGFIFLNSIPIIFIMALTATIAEVLLTPIDDNLAVPIVAGFAGQALLSLMNIF